MADFINQQFGGYQLLRLIGKGGQASVYLGQHLRLQQKYAAIKILHTSVSEQDVKAFQQEANIIAALQHPHIVNVLDFDIQQGIPFLVMEYYPDGSLRERHPRGEQVPLVNVVSYVKQVAEALQHAHDYRLIHRDVKAANMLIGRQGEIVLSDFGIVAIAHSTSSIGTQNFAGTAPYMAPEQITQHPRRESDQYALAVVAYEWLCGQLPFVGTPQEIAIKHLTVEPLSLCQKLPGLSSRVDQVILKALAKEPKERFPSVQEFAVALEQVTQEMPDASSPHAISNQRSISSSPTTPWIPAQPLQQAFPPVAMPPHAALDTSLAALREIQPAPTSSENKADGARSAVPTGISPEKNTLSVRASSQKTRQPVVPDIDGTEVLRRVRDGDIPPSWHVFYASRAEVKRKCLGNGLLGSGLGFLLALVLSPSLLVGALLIIFSGLTVVTGTLLMIALLIIFFGLLAATGTWIIDHDRLLVLCPMGVVAGKRSAKLASLVINYKNVVSMNVWGWKVEMNLRKGTGRRVRVWLDLLVFESPQELSLRINDAYEDFKA
ncbi:hypothetical protein KSF_105920 [Reticulibacter mediterranei]|uniref:Protein kinase domain-containing protein n=1 Tax=Reticulibacter mediterranei TaxID=2778369 RepID=A0A8J3IRA8_9CHLR|nr:serine/threonine-protein kinase [Reticulibacter mediterranei]GHP00545.1 hypothetical protein KSF_105920 [Reticulibacter mediterranei]